MSVTFDIYKSEVLMQLFVQGPTWDGNLISKAERDALVDRGFADRWNGWNFLTQEGVEAAVAGGSPIAAAARVLLAQTEAANDPEIGPWLRAIAE